ncbi:MAG: DEAD/DEAH box helicase family protein [Aestuariivita sp.]|nr:DEAD/DEAH box helicase family protein [Aestuariivita sp.]
MKLHFEDNLDYQLRAIQSVVGLFKGQEVSRSEFTVTYQPESDPRRSLGLIENQHGVGNRLHLIDDDIYDNLKSMQLDNGLVPSNTLESGDFTVEMETGTGKTYVYLRTMFELHREYGFTKFVIVVPSVAIKEGTYKTLEITREHFEVLYPKAKGYEYFLYDSSKLGQVRNFATSSNIQIMVTTVGAINKRDVNNLYKENENTGGEKPIDLIKATNPIIIVDEPQSVDGALGKGKGREALDAMQPLCTLRYSATHVAKHHMVYRLDAVDAYERDLVKQIEVASLYVEGDHNKPYIQLIDTSNRKNSIVAKVELDVQYGNNIKREVLTVEDGDDLAELTKRAIYENMSIGEINVRNETLQVKGPQLDQVLHIGEAIGSVSGDALKRLMIQRTIKEHLDKEMRFQAAGIKVKVLSLFFIDKVEHYRAYDEDGNPTKGKYAQMFEEEYIKLVKSSDYQTLFYNVGLSVNVEDVHEGYFSIDKKNTWQDTAETRQADRDNAERAYNLIMKDKEKLLSFDTKLKFIFSHSALKEGWDNPNVFQICTLRDIGTERERRQIIGRGLRLSVDQDGQRIRDKNVNVLTVIANESYEDFADKLQKEIEDDTGICFGVVDEETFAAIRIKSKNGEEKALGVEASKVMWNFLKEQNYIDHEGRIQDTLRAVLEDDSLELPEEFSAYRADVINILKKLAGKLDIKNADERRTITTREAILDGDDFKALWDRIKHKTTYRVAFDNNKLINDCAQAIEESAPITKTRAQFRKAEIAIGQGGVEGTETAVSAFTTISENDIELPDIITDLQDKTQLTRGSIVQILRDSRRIEDFKRNPQQFIHQSAEAINRIKHLALVDGIRYKRLGNADYYAQELFTSKELTGYLKNILEVQKSVHEYVVYDSVGTERIFAEDLEKNEAVKVYAKLPSWFQIPTPLGTYNPDWAILIEENGSEQIYFVVETKSSGWWDDLRHLEDAKIECGARHFEALCGADKNPAKFIKATSVDDVMAHVLVYNKECG